MRPPPPLCERGPGRTPKGPKFDSPKMGSKTRPTFLGAVLGQVMSFHDILTKNYEKKFRPALRAKKVKLKILTGRKHRRQGGVDPPPPLNWRGGSDPPPPSSPSQLALLQGLSNELPPSFKNSIYKPPPGSTLFPLVALLGCVTLPPHLGLPPPPLRHTFRQ